MIKKLDGLLETVDYESSFLFIIHHNCLDEKYPKHWHSAVEIIMPIKTPYKAILNDTEYILNEYDIIIIPSGELHELSPCTENGERIILQFDLSLFKATEGFLNSSYIFLKPGIVTSNSNPSLHSSLKSILFDILEEYDSKNNYYEAEIISKIINLAVTLARKQNQDAGQDSEYLVKKREHLINFNKCIEYIGEHYKEDLTLNYISGIVGFSKYHFLRWFKQYAKMTFNDYLLQIRLKAAENLLLDYNIPITDVALESGFQSITTFNRVFKNNKKCTPTEYRNYNKGGKFIDYKNKFKQTPYFSEKYPVTNEKNINEKENLKFFTPSQPRPFSVFLPSLLPVIGSGITNPDIIYVDGIYYMTGTFGHFCPICPVMKSPDFINWTIASYVCDVLEYTDDFTLKNNKNNYLNRKLSSSIYYNNNNFYVSFTTDKKHYVFKTDNIENNVWEKRVYKENKLTSSLFFDDNGKTYNIYSAFNVTDNSVSVYITEIAHDFFYNDILSNSNSIKLIIHDNYINKENLKNIRFYKIDNYYCIFFNGYYYRSLNIDGKYTKVAYYIKNKNLNKDIYLFERIINFDNGLKYGLFSQTDKNKFVLFYLKQDENGLFFEYSEQLNIPQNFDYKLNGVFFNTSDEFYQSSYQKSINNIEIPNTDIISKSFYESEAKRLLLNQEILENNDFSNGLSSWTEHESANFSLKYDDHNPEKRVLYVTGRTATASGAKQIVTGKMKRGERFRVSARIKYNSGPTEHTFNLTIKNGRSPLGIHVMCSGKIIKSEWGIIEGIYTLPVNADISETFIFIESAWNDVPSKEDDLMNFFVSCVSVIKRYTPDLDKIIEGEYNFNGSYLSPQWQWNHNPNNIFWSLTERTGFLRLTNGSVYDNFNLPQIKNTLTQQVFMYENLNNIISGTIALEINGMKNNDIAGLAIIDEINYETVYAYIGVKMSENCKYIVSGFENNSAFIKTETMPIPQERIYFKAEIVSETNIYYYFYYSLDGIRWIYYNKYKAKTLKNRYALFNAAIENIGGYVDFDYFRIDTANKPALKSNTADILEASLVCPDKIITAPVVEFDLTTKIKLPPTGNVYFSIHIPKMLDIVNVFQDKSKDCNYILDNERLEFYVENSNASECEATVHLRVNKTITQDIHLIFKPDYIYTNGAYVYDISKLKAEIILKYS